MSAQIDSLADEEVDTVATAGIDRAECYILVLQRHEREQAASYAHQT